MMKEYFPLKERVENENFSNFKNEKIKNNENVSTDFNGNKTESHENLRNLSSFFIEGEFVVSFDDT